MDFHALTEYLNGLPAIGVAGSDTLVCVKGKQVYRHITGYADIDSDTPMSAQTIHQMYSMTKPLTVVCAMQLYERGCFLLEDAVSQYLPEMARLTVRAKDAYGTEILAAPREPLRVRHLFTMTGGFDYNFNAPALRELVRGNPAYTTRDFVRALAREPLQFEPGSHYLYSLCHDVLGALIEVWSGMRFADYARTFVFEPLGMESTWFHVPDDQRARRATKYCFHADTRTFEPLPMENSHQVSENADSGGAGLNSTTDDYMRFANALCAGGVSPLSKRIIGRETLRMVCMNQLSGQCLTDYQNDSKQGYGYGLGVRVLMDKALAGSAGGLGEFGWGGAAGTYLLIDPERALTVVFAEQSLPGHNTVVHRRLRNIIYRALEDD